jgi:excisionase family DNA binding protein
MQTSSIALLAGAGAAPPRALYSPREVENLLSVSHATLYRLIAAGRLDARKIAGKTVVTAQSIERFLAALPPAPVRSA